MADTVASVTEAIVNHRGRSNSSDVNDDDDVYHGENHHDRHPHEQRRMVMHQLNHIFRRHHEDRIQGGEGVSGGGETGERERGTVGGIRKPLHQEYSVPPLKGLWSQIRRRRTNRNRSRLCSNDNHHSEEELQRRVIARSFSPDYSGGSSEDFQQEHPRTVVAFAEVEGSSSSNVVRTPHHRTVNHSFEANSATPIVIGERARYSVHDGKSGCKRTMRVKPFHAFNNEIPVFRTEEEIYAESLGPTQHYEKRLRSYLKPSYSFPSSRNRNTDSVDGRIGILQVEVLGCISLARTKPDVRVYAICGDVAFATDTIRGSRSPMWPTVSRRGAILPLMHAYAKLYIGVFDVKTRKNKDNDVFCGRVALDMALLRPDTEYDVTMPLRASTFVYDRKPRGVIRIRFALSWFNEHATVWSYWQSPQSLARNSPCFASLPTIPCADPKTFRNVVVTVYGQDLPGKFTKTAFRATHREFNLYQQNIRHVIQTLIADAILYENPGISLFLFGGGMHCVYMNSIRLLPPYAVLYILFLILRNHQQYVVETHYNFGYRPLTLWHIAKAVLRFPPPLSNDDTPSFDALSQPKRMKKRQSMMRSRYDTMIQIQQSSQHQSKLRRNSHSSLESDHSHSPGSEAAHPFLNDEMELMDHREFPFSDRDAYPNFTVEEALAKSKTNANASQLHGRLSVYYSASIEAASSASFDSNDDDDSHNKESDDDGHDDESCDCSMVDMMHDIDHMNEEYDESTELDSISNTKMHEWDTKHNTFCSSMNGNISSNNNRRIRLGPPQNSDSKIIKTIPPQVHLKKVEAILHKLTSRVALELIHPPTDMVSESHGQYNKQKDTNGIPVAKEDKSQHERSSPKRKKSHHLDEFDRMLGLQSISRNPITRISGTFLGPLMRMFRIGIYLTRIAFNISTWRDPFMSFWVCLALTVWCLILVWFPWRSFFLLVTVTAVGPQNMLLRVYLQKRRIEKEQEAETSKIAIIDRSDEKKPLRGSGSDHVCNTLLLDREPFRVNDPHEKMSSSRNTKKYPSSRAVAIPYSRFKPDRIYDWPPDPTVSKATPLRLQRSVMMDGYYIEDEPLIQECNRVMGSNATMNLKNQSHQ